MRPAISIVSSGFDSRHRRVSSTSSTWVSGTTSAPSSFREIQVVLVEGVLGAVAAADHAAAAEVAPGSIGARTVEIRIRDGDIGMPEVDADIGGFEGVAETASFGGSHQGVVGFAELGIGDGAEHPSCGGEVLGHDRSPVLEPGPLGIVPHRLGRFEEGVGVDQAAAADPDAVEDERFPEEVEAEDPTAAEPGKPESLSEIPVGLWKIFRFPAFALLDDGDAIALLGEPQRGNRAAET